MQTNISALSNRIAALPDAVLVSAAADMEPDVLASALRSAALSGNDHANAMMPAIFGALAPANSGAPVKVAGEVVRLGTSKGGRIAAKVDVPAAVSKSPRGARKAATKTSNVEASTKGGKRERASSDVIAQRMDMVEAYVLANPGCQAGAVAKHVGCKAPQLANVFRALVGANKISVTGVKNGTRYHAPVSDDAADGRNDIDEGEDQSEAAE